MRQHNVIGLKPKSTKLQHELFEKTIELNSMNDKTNFYQLIVQ